MILSRPQPRFQIDPGESRLVGVSQMQVSRIIRQALRTLRADIERDSERSDAA